MSSGGPFQIVNNNGVQDQMLLNVSDLNKRMNEIAKAKLNYLHTKNANLTSAQLQQLPGWMPTFAEINTSHILNIYKPYKPFVSITSNYIKTQPNGGSKPLFGSTIVFTFPSNYGDYINDGVLHIKLSSFKANALQDKVKYIEMLGHRLLKNSTLKIGNVIIDSYTSDKYNINWQFKVPPGKENGYLRNIGQEIPKVGYLTADPTVDQVREYRMFGDGPQTTKTVQPELDLMIPLLFFFKDLHNAIPNLLLANGMIELSIELEAHENLIGYCNYTGTQGPVYTPPTIKECGLYLNHLYIQPELHPMIVSRTHQHLIRVNKTHRVVLNKASDEVLLNNLIWPVETMYIAFRPLVNLLDSKKWHRNTWITEKTVKQVVVTGFSNMQINNAYLYEETPVVDTIKFIGQGSDRLIADDMNFMFYNSYLPYQHGATTKTPKDLGWGMYTFSRHPNEYQPSGHYNASRDRELRMTYVSGISPDTSESYISTTSPVELRIVTECINFIVYKNNSAYLMFAN